MASNSKDVVDSCSLQVLVPESSCFDPNSFPKTSGSQSSGQDGRLLLSAVSQRTALYFDETISVFLVLQTPILDRPTLDALTERLTISLEAIALGSNTHVENGRDSQHQSSYPPHRDTLWSGQVDTSREPTIIQEEGDGEEAKLRTNLLWKMSVSIGRPRVRLQSPQVSLRPSASARSSNSSSTKQREDRFLPSGVPTSTNLLESLKDEPGLNGVQPSLSALRLSRMNTLNADLASSDRTLKVASQPLLRLMPAINARLRYAKAGNVAGKHAMNASLDVETAPFSDDDITLKKAELRLSQGLAEDLGQSLGLVLPMTCSSRDVTTFLFRLTSNDPIFETTKPISNSLSLDVSIDAVVLASEGSNPVIEMRWRTVVDFSATLNANFGAPNQPLQRSQFKEDEGVSRREQSASMNDLGVSMTFTAPMDIYVGELFNLDVFVVNRSSKPRKLAVLVVPKRKRMDIKTHLSRPSTSSAGGRTDVGVADAVTDENHLYAMHRNAAKEGVHIISLSNDTVVGPLQPGSCFNADLKLLPLASGYLQIEAIRVIDVATNDAVDVRDLPDLIAQERPMKLEERMGD